MTDTDPAVEAAAEALLRTGSLPLHMGEIRFAAEIAVAAARPIIEAEVRERIAGDIEARTIGLDRYGEREPWVSGYDHAIEDAARIARGEQ